LGKRGGAAAHTCLKEEGGKGDNPIAKNRGEMKEKKRHNNKRYG